MTEVSDAPVATATAPSVTDRRRSPGGLAGMKLAELQQVAQQLGMSGVRGLRKGDLVAAIETRQTAGYQPSGEPVARAPRRRAAPESSGNAPADVPAETSARNGSAVNGDVNGAATDAPNGATSGGSTANGARNGTRNGTAPSGTAGTAAEGTATTGTAVNGRTQDRPAESAGGGGEPTTPDALLERAELRSRGPAGAPDQAPAVESRSEGRQDRPEARENGSRRDQASRQDSGRQDNGRQDSDRQDRHNGEQNGRQSTDRGQQGRQNQQDRGQQDRQNQQQDRGQQDRGQQDRGQQDRQDQGPDRGQQDRGGAPRYDDEEGGRRRRRRGRDRLRDRNDRPDRNDRQDRPNDRSDRTDRRPNRDGEQQVSDNDVLVPVAGILDVLDSYAFVRTAGYLAGPNDIYVPLTMVKRYGLRKGDAVTGVTKAAGESDRREKFNAIVRIDTVNGTEPDASKNRVEFGKLTPLYPQQRLRLETEPNVLTTRVIDLVAPLGKGQRGLIVAPAKTGKTIVLQTLANAITTNNPEVHLMVVLVDERPEEVTDMQRAVKGEVIASTFDRPASDHTQVAELAIERAKRLVELGHDVVVLLDSITRLGRAYNIAAPASGRILSGGVDSSALYPPKRFFGAARNIENGGSLTILATALVDTGSRMDEVIFEEFKGTGNMELRLSRQLADRRIFPAVDVLSSGTRRDEILVGHDELQVLWKLRRVLSGLETQAALELMLNRLRKTRTNAEFLLQVQKTTPGGSDD